MYGLNAVPAPEIGLETGKGWWYEGDRKYLIAGGAALLGLGIYLTMRKKGKGKKK